MTFWDELMEYVKKYKSIYEYKTNSYLYNGFYVIKDNIIFTMEFSNINPINNQTVNDSDVIRRGYFTLKVNMKDMNYDEIYFNYDSRKEKVHVTNTIRLNPGYDFITISEKKINILYDKKNKSYINMEKICKEICEDSLSVINNFIEEIKKDNIDIKDYYFLNKDKYPMQAGYEYISISDYENALKCFKIAEEKDYGKNIHVGSYGNCLVNVMIEFCEKKLNA